MGKVTNTMMIPFEFWETLLIVQRCAQVGPFVS
jgi:hypothetical protein